MFRTATPEEVAQAKLQNDEQAAAHAFHRLHSPMVSEQTRKAIADEAAKSAAYQAERKTAAEQKTVVATERKKMIELCTQASYTGPHAQLVSFAVLQAGRAHEMATLSTEELQQKMATAVTLCNIELDSRGLTPLTDREFAKMRAFLMAKGLLLWDSNNLLIAFTILNLEAGLRKAAAPGCAPGCKPMFRRHPLSTLVQQSLDGGLTWN